MKILYGVQGTGNGHISRAKAMAEAFALYPQLEVTWLISGRSREVATGLVNNYLWRRGPTFVTDNGEVSYLKTLQVNDFYGFARDVRSLSVDAYDCVVTDFEPIVAWAAKRRGISVTGIGHQYAFSYPVPTAGFNRISRAVMRNFAPVTHAVGLHWHHFGYPVLPPILDLKDHDRNHVFHNKIVVYLPFENQDKVIRILRGIDSHEFYIYGPEHAYHDTCNVHTRPFSRDSFQRDLVNAAGVICNTGFELISECLALGVRVLTKPLAKQPEQLSNARALRELGYAKVASGLTTESITDWLRDRNYVRIRFPEVHRYIAYWLATGREKSNEELASMLWNTVRVERS